MPAEFRDDTMRNFFRVKFEEFVYGTGSFIARDDDIKDSFTPSPVRSASGKVDFAKEHLERQRYEYEYIKGTGFVRLEEADVEVEYKVDDDGTGIDGDTPQMTENLFTLQEKNRGIICYRFNAEVERAQKSFVDAREVCLIDWEIRENGRKFFEKLTLNIKQIIRGKHLECHGKETETVSCEMLVDEAKEYTKLIRDINLDFEKNQSVCQILEDTLVNLEDILARFKQLISTKKCTKHDEMAFLESVSMLVNSST